MSSNLPNISNLHISSQPCSQNASLEYLRILSSPTQQMPVKPIAGSSEVDDSDESLSRLHNSIDNLKRENRRLCNENEDLHEEVVRLRAILESERNTSVAVSALRKPFVHPPPEILYMIFIRSVSPTFLLDATVSPGPDSAWCKALRQKKSLALVCREWHKVGLQLLYEDVCFRRIYQLPAFLRTIESAPGDLGSLVKQLFIYAFIPNNRYSATTNRYLRRVFDLCPRITHFGYTSPCYLPPNVLTAPRTATHLVLSEMVHFHILTSLMTQVSNILESVSFHVTAIDRGFWDTPTLLFPRLHSLLCVVSPGTRKHLNTLANMWTLPSLCHLTFKIIGNPINWESQIATHEFVSFCSMHGKNLKSLHFHPEYWWSMSTYCIDIQQIIDACLSLEHLILHPKTLPLSHPNVKWVDVWSPHVRNNCAEDWMRLFTSINSQSFPSLIGTRLISNPLSCLPDIPRAIPPGQVNHDGEAFDLEFPGIHIKHICGHLFTVEHSWSDEGVDAGLEDDGDLYIYVSEDEDGGDNVSDSTSSDEDETSASSTEDGTEGEEDNDFFIIDQT